MSGAAPTVGVSSVPLLSRGIHICSHRKLLKWMVFFLVSHYVPSYCDNYYYHPTYDSCVLEFISHDYDCYDGSHLWGPKNTVSTWCGSVATVHFWGVLLASPPCCNNICSPRWLLRHIQTLSWVHCKWVFSFRIKPFHQFICNMLMSVMLCAFCFQGSHVAAMFTNGSSLIGVCSITTLWSISLQVYIPPGICLCLTPGVYWVSASPTVSSRGSFMLLIQLSPAIPSIWEMYHLWGPMQSNPLCLHFPHMMERHLLFQVLFHLMTW